MGLVGNGWANCFRTHNELTMDLPGKYPSPPVCGVEPGGQCRCRRPSLSSEKTHLSPQAESMNGADCLQASLNLLIWACMRLNGPALHAEQYLGSCIVCTREEDQMGLQLGVGCSTEKLTGDHGPRNNHHVTVSHGLFDRWDGIRWTPHSAPHCK